MCQTLTLYFCVGRLALHCDVVKGGIVIYFTGNCFLYTIGYTEATDFGQSGDLRCKRGQLN